MKESGGENAPRKKRKPGRPRKSVKKFKKVGTPVKKVKKIMTPWRRFMKRIHSREWHNYVDICTTEGFRMDSQKIRRTEGMTDKGKSMSPPLTALGGIKKPLMRKERLT